MNDLTFQESEAVYEARLTEFANRRRVAKARLNATRKARRKARELQRKEARVRKLSRGLEI